MTAKDDAYVRLLERDLEILRRVNDNKDRDLEAIEMKLASLQAAARRKADVVAELLKAIGVETANLDEQEIDGRLEAIHASIPAALRNVPAGQSPASKAGQTSTDVLNLRRRLSVREAILGVLRNRLAEMEERDARRQAEMASLATQLSSMRHDIAKAKSDGLNIAFRALCIDFRDLTRMRAPLVGDHMFDVAVRKLSAAFGDHLKDCAARSRGLAVDGASRSGAAIGDMPSAGRAWVRSMR